MTSQDKERLSKMPRSKCYKCSSRRAYSNPLGKCWECEQKFCFDHIWSGQVNDSMKLTEEIRNICEQCKKINNYKDL